MAMEPLVNLVTIGLTKLAQQANFLLGVDGQVEELQERLRFMRSILEKAGEKQEEDEVLLYWRVPDIRQAVYDAEDIVDMFNLKEKASRRNPVTSIPKKLTARYKVGRKIENLRAKLKFILPEGNNLEVPIMGITGTSCSDRTPPIERHSSPRMEVHDQVTIGMEEKEAQLVKQLIKGDPRRQVICIVGMAGIGKTALAKRVYNHKNVKDHFGGCRFWVSVSQDRKPREIYKRILDMVYTEPAASREEAEKMIKEFEEEQLGDFLRNKLEGKKYLVILDDVWTRDDWDRLAKVSINETDSLGRVFPDNGNGSRLLVTSRDENVALHADAQVPPLRMQFLSQEESWDLFCRKAFPDADPKSCHPSLKTYGEMMAKKCNGLPLAIVVLGDLLLKYISGKEWRTAPDNMDVHLAERDQRVMGILNLSYVTLPSHLKLCFLHLSLFPEDHVISTRKLLSLWVAEGFVQKQRGNNIPRRLKDTANDYLNQLISRNLVQVVRMSVRKRVMECRVHELVRKLAIEKARAENFITVDSPSTSTDDSCSSSPQFRWQSVYSSDFERYASMKHSTPCLRTLIFSRLDGAPTSGLILNVRFIYKCFKRLRVLDLEGLKITSLPKTIGKLILLRYLGLRNTGLETLPSSIKGLWSLETLDTNNLKKVPKEICEIKNLRDLYMDGQEDPTFIGVDKLKNLQNLSGIRSDQWIFINASELTCLEKLKLEGRFEKHEANLSNSISQLPKLRSLYLKASDGSVPPLVMANWPQLSKLDITGHMQKLPEANEFPPSLTQLTLEATELHDDPMPILEQLPELLTLRLRKDSYTGDKMQVSPKGFSKLNVLQISELIQSTKLNIESGAMPWLTELQFYEKLQISKLSELKKLVEVDVIGHIHEEILFHMLPQNGDWKCKQRSNIANPRSNITELRRMAETVVSFVVENMGHLLIQTAIILKGAPGQVERRLDEQKRMHADARQEEDERVRNWVSETQNAAYDAENLVDIFISNAETKNLIFKK